jgi:BirA family biotin operon repressor/biotin-[acetyl-CoA-carboxylase] ligase
MLSERALEEALTRAGLSAPVRFDEVTGSTNQTAIELAEAGTPEWTLVGAGHQTAGRGRLGRSWADEPSGALLFSIVLRPDLPGDRAAWLPLLAGLCVARACRDACRVQVGCKWPNDLVTPEGKVGGVLIESRVLGRRIDWVVAGIGLNLGEAPASIPGAAGLGGCDGAGLLTGFLVELRRMYRPSHPAFGGAVLAGYREICVSIGRDVRATTVGGGTVEGRAVDVDERGALVVETPSGREVVAFGEVQHVTR